MAVTPSTPAVRKKIFVRGIVQGVGFRPFAYNLACSLELSGYVLNSSAGVTIEVEGGPGEIARFVDRLRTSPPPLAQITDIAVTEIPAREERGFNICESLAEDGAFVLVSTDVATCDDCWREFGDPANRRYGYPFTNCTNCGPRYTIIQDIPYDRPKTTMAGFRMCGRCRAEYENPADRRFHAQPNACPDCGPSVVLMPSGSSLPVTEDFAVSKGSSLSILRAARALLKEGKILAVRGLGGYLLACDACNDSAVKLLRERKHRSEKPFAVMARDLAAVQSFAELRETERAALASPRRPIVILARRPHANLSSAISPGNPSIGVMLPYTPLHHLLFSDSPDEPSEFPALVMTSGNLSEEPIVTSNEAAWRQLAPIADWFLAHNRDIYMRADDSVTRVMEAKERLLRRSRGFAPQPIDLGVPVRELLACGAELKNTLCLTKGRYAILSQHIGDMENYETLQFFEETLSNLKKLFRVQPEAVAYDLHPGYMSSRFARALPLEVKIAVQHHHAHIASCMAENHLSGKVIGVAFDGTGYGTDGRIWGGEFLVADFAGFERRAHLRYLPLPGGDAGVRQPWRMALSYLRDTFGGSLPTAALAFAKNISQKKIAIVDAMIEKRIQVSDTSSCGRLFDAVAALVGLKQQVTFEGQAAIELEFAVEPGIRDLYPFRCEAAEPITIDMRPMIEAIVRDIAKARSTGYIAACFHNTIAAMIANVCSRLRNAEGWNRVCLSGGVFQNSILLERTVEALRAAGFEVFLHSAVPSNDGGISLGQAAIANEYLRRAGSPAGA